MANPFEVMVSNLNQLGFFGFLLPWVFMFVVAFGLLWKYKVLGEDVRISVVTALVLAFFVVGFGGPFLASFFVNIFGIGAAVIAGILVLVLFMGMAGMKLDEIAKNKAVLVFFIAIAIIIFAVAAGATRVLVNQTTIATVLMIIFLGAIVYAVAGGAKKD